MPRRVNLLSKNGTSTKYAYSLRGDLVCHDWNFTGGTPGSCNGGAPEAAYDFVYNGAGQVISKAVSDSALVWAPASNGLDDYMVNGLNQYTAITPQAEWRRRPRMI